MHEFQFLAHLIELKAQVSFSDCLSSVCLSIWPSVCLSICLKTFSIFFFFSRTTGPFSTLLGTKHPWVVWIQVCSNKGPGPFPRKDNINEIARICWQNLNISSSRTTGPFFNQTWHKTSLGGGDSSLFKWKAKPFSKGRQLQKSKI